MKPDTKTLQIARDIIKKRIRATGGKVTKYTNAEITSMAMKMLDTNQRTVPLTKIPKNSV